MPNHLAPHDRLLRTIMAKPKVIKEFFNGYLPIDIKSQLDLDSIQLQSESFLDDQLRTQATDLLYKTRFGKKSGYLYLLIEHQSMANKLLAFRLLKYIMAIMEYHLEISKDKQLPIVYPIVLYNGKKSYNYSTDIFDLFGDQRELAANIFCQPYQLLDLQQVTDKKLKNHLWFGVLARLMKHIYSTELSEIKKQNDWEHIYAIAEQYRAKGRAEAMYTMAIKLLKISMPIDQIAQLTEISKDQLQILQAKLSKQYH